MSGFNRVPRAGRGEAFKTRWNIAGTRRSRAWSQIIPPAAPYTLTFEPARVENTHQLEGHALHQFYGPGVRSSDLFSHHLVKLVQALIAADAWLKIEVACASGEVACGSVFDVLWVRTLQL